jgi:hypothetical protein
VSFELCGVRVVKPRTTSALCGPPPGIRPLPDVGRHRSESFLPLHLTTLHLLTCLHSITQPQAPGLSRNPILARAHRSQLGVAPTTTHSYAPTYPAHSFSPLPPMAAPDPSGGPSSSPARQLLILPRRTLIPANIVITSCFLCPSLSRRRKHSDVFLFCPFLESFSNFLFFISLQLSVPVTVSQSLDRNSVKTGSYSF